jgi:hypothetical protein
MFFLGVFGRVGVQTALVSFKFNLECESDTWAPFHRGLILYKIRVVFSPFSDTRYHEMFFLGVFGPGEYQVALVSSKLPNSVCEKDTAHLVPLFTEVWLPTIWIFDSDFKTTNYLWFLERNFDSWLFPLLCNGLGSAKRVFWSASAKWCGTPCDTPWVKIVSTCLTSNYIFNMVRLFGRDNPKERIILFLHLSTEGFLRSIMNWPPSRGQE